VINPQYRKERYILKMTLKAEYYRGKVKATNGQQKKHVTQMTREEISYLVQKCKNIPLQKVTISKHLLQKGISFKKADILTTLQTSNLNSLIIEYNETPKSNGSTDKRVLIRSNISKDVEFETKNGKKFTSPAQMCFVISLKTYEVITVYWNKSNDGHTTMDWSRYQKHLKILK
jgi:hypothetical protein